MELNEVLLRDRLKNVRKFTSAIAAGSNVKIIAAISYLKYRAYLIRSFKTSAISCWNFTSISWTYTQSFHLVLNSTLLGLASNRCWAGIIVGLQPLRLQN